MFEISRKSLASARLRNHLHKQIVRMSVGLTEIVSDLINVVLLVADRNAKKRYRSGLTQICRSIQIHSEMRPLDQIKTNGSNQFFLSNDFLHLNPITVNKRQRLLPEDQTFPTDNFKAPILHSLTTARIIFNPLSGRLHQQNKGRAL